jgi:hypothetical protein
MVGDGSEGDPQPLVRTVRTVREVIVRWVFLILRSSFAIL